MRRGLVMTLRPCSKSAMYAAEPLLAQSKNAISRKRRLCSSRNWRRRKRQIALSSLSNFAANSDLVSCSLAPLVMRASSVRAQWREQAAIAGSSAVNSCLHTAQFLAVSFATALIYNGATSPTRMKQLVNYM